MALPKIGYPSYECSVPTTKKNIKYRPMLVKEEKILLMAKQSGERFDFYNSLKQVVNNCVIDKIDINKLSLCDIQYLFTQIRINSISNIAKVSYIDNEDEKQYDFDIDLTKITTTELPASNKIDLDTNLILTLNFPPITLYTVPEFYTATEEERLDMILSVSMDKIYQGDQVYDCSGATAEEKKTFIDSIPAKAYVQIKEFFNKIPTLFYEIKYKNSKGTERTITLLSVEDFFTFG